MPIRLAILGLDPIQRDWLSAVAQLAESSAITPVAAGHRSVALARDTADILHVPAFDDMRTLMREAAPQVILLDRPENVSAEFLAYCLSQNVGLLSVGPPVRSVAEARAIADYLEPQTHLLCVAPAFVHTPGYIHGTHPDVVTRPVRFISSEFHAFHHAAAKAAGRDGSQQPIVRSLSTLAWDALAALVDLLGTPESLFASVRGTTSPGDSFADITGAAGLVLRFTTTDGNSTVVTVALSDRAPAQRIMHLLTATGSARVEEFACQSLSAEGQVLDDTGYPRPSPTDLAADSLRRFLEQFTAPTSPHRGWPHRLEQLAACMEALIVSHRTGQPESPEKFLTLRR